MDMTPLHFSFWRGKFLSETQSGTPSTLYLCTMEQSAWGTWVSWASCRMRNIAGAHAPGMPWTFSPPPRVSDPDMYHGTCVTHVPWCMPGSLTGGFLWSRPRGKTFPAFPARTKPAILRIWQEVSCFYGISHRKHENTMAICTNAYVKA